MNEWLDDFKTAVAFLTRLPMPHPQGSMPPNFVRAHRMFPVVGALIGAAIGLFCLALRGIGLPDLAAAALALGAGAILTGALHEDGLADVADGFAALKRGAEGVLKVTVRAAIALEAAQSDALKAALAKRFGRQIELTSTIDESVIGGAIIDAGDTVIDGLVRGRLERLAQTLTH